MAIARLKPYEGPALFSYGFRPFFLFGSLYAFLTITFWIPQFQGALELSTHMLAVDWHIHELIFGFSAAVIAGFLFTAVPNWTGRLPLQGWPLIGLVIVWVLGRVAVSFSSIIGWFPALVVDLSFLLTLSAVISREIIVGRNWRNLKILVPLGCLTMSNLFFHLEIEFVGSTDISRRFALMTVIVLILIVGGRIIPSFTRNWLVRENPGQLPKPFGLYEKLTLVSAVITAVCWILLPEHRGTGVLMLLCAGLLFWQLYRWQGIRGTREILLLVLHVSYFFVPLGFLLVGIAILRPEDFSQMAGIHALGSGAIGGMTLSVMLRATKGHTGRILQANAADKILFILIFLAVFLRILSAITFDVSTALLIVSGAMWGLAYLGYAVIYAAAFLNPGLSKGS